MDVAQKMMTRVRHNLILLFEHLQVLNYRFTEGNSTGKLPFRRSS